MTGQFMEGYVPLLSMIVLANLLFPSLGSPLGLFSDYSTYGEEFSIKIRERERNRLDIFTSDDQLYMTVVGRRDKKLLFDDHGVVVLNIRNRVLNFGGEYKVGGGNYILHSYLSLISTAQIFEGEADTLPLFTVRNKWSLGGPRMVANFVNFDDRPSELQVRGKLLNSSGKVMLDGQTIAKFEDGNLEPMAGKPKKFETVTKITIAPLGTLHPPPNTFHDWRCFSPSTCHRSRCFHDCDHLCVPARYFK